eukprot:7774367-Lingulodinium_polyedra.AAC.1
MLSGPRRVSTFPRKAYQKCRAVFPVPHQRSSGEAATSASRQFNMISVYTGQPEFPSMDLEEHVGNPPIRVWPEQS